MKSRTVVILVLITLAAFVLRFNGLGSLPALNADEAAIGYNAYSLSETGRDEHGNSWPIHFESFGDFKPGLVFYLVMPFVKLFGLSILSVRFLPALLGVLTVPALYFLLVELFKERKLGIFASLLLAISPWHIHFSRGAWEVNVATFFMITGVWAFLRSRKENKYLFLSALFFVLALYAYHSARVIVPLLVLGLLIIYRKNLFAGKNIGNTLLVGAFSFVVLLPLLNDLRGGAVLARAGGVGIFADRGTLDRINEQRGQHSELTGFAAPFLHNKPVGFGLAFAENYLRHFWGEFLFLSGDEIQRNAVPEMGQLYLFQLPLILTAFWAIAKKPKSWLPVLLWLIVAPVAAALTFQSPHALRSQNMVVPLTIISAYGLIVLVRFLNRKLTSRYLLVTSYLLLVAVLTWSFSRYLHQYYTHMPKAFPFSSQYGARELAEYVIDREDEVEEVYITDRYDQPYILLLFYGASAGVEKFMPWNFQDNHVLTPANFGFMTVSRYDKFHFRNFDWDVYRDFRNVLLVGASDEVPDIEANVVEVILFPNGETAYEIVRQ